MASVFELLNRKTVRSEPNPLDRTTIVSIFPNEIQETIITIQPSLYVIPGGSLENPSILVVSSASWWKETSPNEPLMEIPVYSTVLAKNLVADYINGMNCVVPGVRGPGLFVIPGEYTSEAIKKNYASQLKLANERQNLWYLELIKQADSLWARTNGNPNSVGDDARMAARILQKDKPWTQDFQAIENVNCVACGNLRNPTYPVCPHCRNIVDVELAKKLNIKAATS